MTWRELKELIDKMSPEEQENVVMIWSDNDCPRTAEYFKKVEKNIYCDWWDSYCYDEDYIKSHPEEDVELVLEKGEYYLKS